MGDTESKAKLKNNKIKEMQEGNDGEGEEETGKNKNAGGGPIKSFFKSFERWIFLHFLILVIVSANIQSFSVSCMQNFQDKFLYMYHNCHLTHDCVASCLT